MVYIEDIVGFYNATFGITGSLMGIDYGASRIGLAISDRSNVMAFAYDIIKNDKCSTDFIAKYCIDNEVKGIVVGMPKMLDGIHIHALQHNIDDFIKNLCNIISIDILLWDERMSTRGAINEFVTNIKRSPRSRKSKKIGHQDDHAARYILQGALNRLATISL